MSNELLSPKGASDSQLPSKFEATRSREELSYQSMSFELDLADNRGRSVSLSINMEKLNFQGTYDKFGSMQGMPAYDKARMAAGNEFGKQATYMEHREVSMNYESFSFEIEGDASLLKDYFSSPATAQRIFDFATGLGAGIEKASPEFGSFINEITSGIQEGFEMAQSVIGELPSISEETKLLLEMMLQAFKEDPEKEISALDFAKDTSKNI